MSWHTFSNPDLSDISLHTFSTLNHPLEEGALEPLQSSLQRGEVSIHDLWLLEGDGEPHAALRLQPYPGQPGWRLGTLRTAPDIPDDAVTVLLSRLRELSAQGNPIHLVYNDKTARDFGTLPARCGWQGGDAYGVSHRTDLSERDDLHPDPAARALELDALFGEAFRDFYEPIREMKRHPSDERSFEEAMQTLHAFAKRDEGRLYALYDAGLPVAMGLVTCSTVLGERVAGVNMLGVTPNKWRQGWGKRLHRHLMWAARQRSPLYLGGTANTNVAMLRLFELGGCTLDRKDWELEPA